MRDREIPDTWAEAANAADFPIYELVGPKPQARWAGGYGWGAGAPVSLEILFAVAGDEISVETIGEKPHAPGSLLSRHLALKMLGESLHGEAGDLELPRTWSMDWADRVIHVDGSPREFRGIGLDDQWTGSVQLANGVIVVLRCPGQAVPEAIAQCRNWAMSDRPPMDS